MRIIVKGVGEITIAFSGKFSYSGHLEILHGVILVIRFSQASGNREKEEGKMDAFKHINPKFLVW